jgi:hypothetical protein
MRTVSLQVAVIFHRLWTILSHKFLAQCNAEHYVKYCVRTGVK